MRRGVRRGLMLLATGTLVTLLPCGAFAQNAPDVRSQLPPGAVVQPLDDGPGTQLRRALTALGENPRSLEALVNAGRAALAMDDPQAALTFFSRAEEVAPDDARAEAGMAAALVRVGQPRAALGLFQEAVAHGAPESEIAADRGLAHDLSGEPRLAQQDYQLALRRGEDEELRRRLALSLAISGQRDAALRTIDSQLRRNDRAAWRTQAFILALTGDTSGAHRTARNVMPEAAADAMAPFLTRLAGLTPQQKAAAVHLGTFPTDGRSTAYASAAPPAYQPPAASPTTRPNTADNEGRSVRRRPDTMVSPIERAAVTGRARQEAAPVRVAEAQPRRAAPAPTPEREPPASPPATQSVTRRFAPAPEPAPPPAETNAVVATPVPTIEADPGRFTLPASQPPALAEASPPPATEPEPRPTITTITPPASQPAQDLAAAETSTTAEAAPSAGTETVAEPAASSAANPPSPGFTLAPQPSPPATTSGLSDIAALVRDLPREERRVAAATPPPAAATPARQQSPASRTTERATAPSTREIRAATAGSSQRNARTRTPARPVHPSRHWVQVAGGANRSTLGRAYAAVRDRAPQLLRNRTPYTTPLRATNRILVGPFRTAAEAQAFVNQLSRANVSAFAWTSEAGQEIERIQMSQ